MKDPWRYCCPKCGSHSLRYRSSLSREDWKDEGGYYCTWCNRNVHKYDKKDDVVRWPDGTLAQSEWER